MREAPHFAALTLAAIIIVAALPLTAQEPFDYFRNSWSVIGLKDYERGTRITPDNQLLLAGKDRVSIAVGNPPTPLSRRQTKTLLEGWLPVVLVTTSTDNVRYEFLFWATPLPTAADWTRAFAWPTDGENYLNWVAVKATNAGARKAAAKIQLKRWTAKEDYVKVAESPPENPEDILKRQTFVQEFSWTLKPGEVKEGQINFPFFPVKGSEGFLKEDSKIWLKRTVDFWKSLMAQAAHLSVPCRKATEAFMASQVCQLLALDRGEIHAGEGFYDVFYIRDGAYTTMNDLCRGLDEQVVEDFYWYLLHSTAAQAFPEGVYYQERTAWGETIPHATGASNYALLLRHMLVHEAGNELHLLPAVPDWWLGEGEEIRIERAPTHFGVMSLVVRGTASGVRVEFTPPQRERPKKIILHLPQSRPFEGTLKGIKIVCRPVQKKRWDFETVVRLYKEKAPPLLKK